jgi:hypothetical protein
MDQITANPPKSHTVPAGAELVSGLVVVTGPGSHLKEVIAGLGLSAWEGCRCEAAAHQMNVWGVEGCKEHRQEIIEWLKEAYRRLSWKDCLTAAVSAFPFVSLLDPIGSLVDEAIRRAEKE